MRLTMHFWRWIRRREEPQPPDPVAESSPDTTLEPATDGGWQNRRYSSGSHRAREYAEHADFPQAVREPKD